MSMDDDSNKKILSPFVTKFSEFLEKMKTITYNDVVLYMYQPTDPASLGIIRFLFGLLMMIDIPEERGGADLDLRWGDAKCCHFPLFPFMEAPSFSYMSLLFCSMWFGAFGIMLGYKFLLSTLLFSVPYWYIFLLDKSFWNNHSYLYGLVSILLLGSSANHYFSLDEYLDPTKRNKHVPYWNYFVLKFQFFILYFYAGLKKTDAEWLEGYSMSDLGHHWVFSPFQFFLSFDKIDYLIVHWFGFLLDLTIGFWMLLKLTRPVAMVFCLLFHLMNSRLFSIGMFPYVCIATMPLFCEESWPRKLKYFFTGIPTEKPVPSKVCFYQTKGISGSRDTVTNKGIKWKHKIIVGLLIGYCGLQIFLPYSHFITKGYNNWTNGLYGYSWDMMVHSWNTIKIVVKIVDNPTGKEFFIDPSAFNQNERWSKHADMCVQYAHCLKKNLRKELTDDFKTDDLEKFPREDVPSDNMSIYIDVWCSLNKRFQQRMFNPKYDVLKANWSPFKAVEWLMPVLSEYNNLRETMNDITQEVYSWSNESDVLFIADFPGLSLENYIQKDLYNVTLTVLEGDVVYEIDDDYSLQSVAVRLKKGDSIPIEVGILHKIHTISRTPSCYMYTYARGNTEDAKIEKSSNRLVYSPFPLLENVEARFNAFLMMWKHIVNSVFHLIFNTPCNIRSNLTEK